MYSEWVTPPMASVWVRQLPSPSYVQDSVVPSGAVRVARRPSTVQVKRRPHAGPAALRLNGRALGHARGTSLCVLLGVLTTWHGRMTTLRVSPSVQHHQQDPDLQLDYEAMATHSGPEMTERAWHQKLPGTASRGEIVDRFLNAVEGRPAPGRQSRLGEDGQVLELSPIPLLL